MAENLGPQSHSEIVTEPDPDRARLFSDLIARLEEGVLNQDLTEQVKTIIAALHDSQQNRGGKPAGSLTLTLSFKLDDGIVEVRSEHKAKTPKEVRGRSLYWATPDNMLTGRNPRQRDMFPPRAAPVRTIRDVS